MPQQFSCETAATKLTADGLLSAEETDPANRPSCPKTETKTLVITKTVFQTLNSFHPTIKFKAEISETETTLLGTKVYKGDRFNKQSILGVRTHFKPTETFQYTEFFSCHPPGVTKHLFVSLISIATNSVVNSVCC